MLKRQWQNCAEMSTSAESQLLVTSCHSIVVLIFPSLKHCISISGLPPPQSAPQEEYEMKTNLLPMPIQIPKEDTLPNEHTNSLKKPQAPAVPEDDGFTRYSTFY